MAPYSARRPNSHASFDASCSSHSINKMMYRPPASLLNDQQATINPRTALVHRGKVHEHERAYYLSSMSARRIQQRARHSFLPVPDVPERRDHLMACACFSPRPIAAVSSLRRWFSIAASASPIYRNSTQTISNMRLEQLHLHTHRRWTCGFHGTSIAMDP